MKYIYRLLKVKGNEYCHIYKGNSTFDMEYIMSLGSANKLAKRLEKNTLLLEFANKYPELWANFQEQKKQELAKYGIMQQTREFKG